MDPRLNINLTNIWLYLNIPQRIIKEINLPEKDRGIDLLAIIDNKYYAIQCKFRQDPSITIAWKDLSTFYSNVQVHDKIGSGFLVTNTYDLVEESYKSKTISNNKLNVFPVYFPNVMILLLLLLC